MSTESGELHLWRRTDGWTGNLEQAWFAGVHSNVGGSYSPDGLANEALHWIVEKAEALGLEFDEKFLGHYRPCFNPILHDSMGPLYRLAGPFSRPIGNQPSDGEVVHQSAIDRLNLPSCGYNPANLRVYLREATPARVGNTARIARGSPC